MALADDLQIATVEKYKGDLYPSVKAIIAELRAVAGDKDLGINRELSTTNQKSAGFMPVTGDSSTVAWLESQKLIVEYTSNPNGTVTITKISW